MILNAPIIVKEPQEEQVSNLEQFQEEVKRTNQTIITPLEEYKINDNITFKIPKNWQARQMTPDDFPEVTDLIIAYDFYNFVNEELHGIIRIKALQKNLKNSPESLTSRALEELKEMNIEVDNNTDNGQTDLALKVYPAKIIGNDIPQEVHLALFEKDEMNLVFFLLTPKEEGIRESYNTNLEIIQDLVKTFK